MPLAAVIAADAVLFQGLFGRRSSSSSSNGRGSSASDGSSMTSASGYVVLPSL